MKPWQRVKEMGRMAPNPVDEKYGFLDQVFYRTSHPGLAAIASPEKLDRMRVGRIEDGRRYIGGGSHQVVNHPPHE